MDPIVLFGGKFPLSDGVPAIYSEADIEECCCPAPCECPCETWPPESWPCGGLLEEYIFELPPWGSAEYDNATCSGDVIEVSVFGNRILPCTLTAGESPCTWEGLAMRQFTDDDPQGSPTWYDTYDVLIRVRLVDAPPCRWVLEVVEADSPSNVLWSGHKLTGLTPTGEYIDDADPDGLRPTCTISNPYDPPEEQFSIYSYGSGATIS
jgi:hypothetical protein